MKQNKTSPLVRITVIDALRGFALLGVVIVHMSQHFGLFSVTGIIPRESLFPQFDETIQWFIKNIILGKFINIFAFLFGVSFFIQMDSAEQKGIDFRKRFLWRMVVLFVIGVISNCFYSGDILTIYSIFGVIMVALFPFKNWILMIIASLLLIGTPRIVSTIFAEQSKTEQIEVTPTPRQNLVVEKHTFLNSVKINLTTKFKEKLKYQFGINGRGFLTLTLFILGFIAGRTRFFEKINSNKRHNILLFAVFIIIATIAAFTKNTLPWQETSKGLSISRFTVYALRDISSLLYSGAIVIGFTLISQLKIGGKILNVLSPYGRMGLTNYVMQSIIGSLMFSMWAFGSLFGGLGATEVFIVGIVLFATQVIASKYWMRYYLYGPFEWAWRSATYLKMQTLKRK